MHVSGSDSRLSDRRNFLQRGLLATAAGVGVGVPVGWWGAQHLAAGWRQLAGAGFTGQSVDAAPAKYLMPGPYPGRVVEVRHPHVVSRDHVIDRAAVDAMVDRGMAELTGQEPGDVKAAWGRFFSRDDVVGIKVNPVGRKPKPGEGGRAAHAVGAISNFEVVVKIVRSLRELGLPPQNIILFDRYASEFIEAGYADFVARELPGVRWYAASAGGSAWQLDLAGFDGNRDSYSVETARHVVGYDPDVFVSMGFCQPDHPKKDDRRFRSHLTSIVTRLCSKVINLPVLKDHRSAGVTLALKNMSHGMNNNVARSHIANVAHGFADSPGRVIGPNQCNTFIPHAAGQHALRQKATLHIVDGLIGVYEGGPGSWNRTWGTWRHQGLLFATDPVALDHVGWDIIDSKRATLGWEPVERMGWSTQTPWESAATGLAPLAGWGAAQVALLAGASENRLAGRASEVFNMRQPEHIALAGELGLGKFDRESILYRQFTING